MVGEVGFTTLILLGGLLLLSGFFSGSEAALLSVQRVRIQHMVSVKTAGAARVGPGVATYTVEGDGMIAAAAEQIGETPTPAGLEAVTVAAAPRTSCPDTRTLSGEVTSIYF